MTPVEAALILKKKIDPGRLEEITIFTNSTAMRVAGHFNPGSEYQAKFSMPYCAAAALVFGQVTQKEFGAEAMGDPEVRALMGRIRLQADEAFDRGFDRGRPARIEAVTKDGRKVVTEASCRRGDPQDPLSHEEIRDKFYALAGSVWNRETLDAVWSRGDRLPDIEKMGTWLAGLPVQPSAAKKTRHRKDPHQRKER
jgi:2-methylcitrate dehydratase PrpD